MKPGNTYLTTADLGIGYAESKSENRLFRHLNLTLEGGQMICFMGPNGAGKSSLLRTLAGLQKPLSGDIQLYPPEGREDVSKQIAVVLTDRIQMPNLTVQEIVTFGRYPYLGWNITLTETDRKIIRAAIERIHLEPLLNKKIYELSDGQLQLVMIARALAQDTPVILLDEPTAHLDLNNRVEIMNLLRDLSRTTRRAILLATHELDLALQTADVIWLTGKNQNILAGLPEDLVLNGSFDDIFQFKGFDLKTGKVLHTPFRETMIKLTGAGAPYLWTKNALERNGFGVTSEEQSISITLAENSGELAWVVKKNNDITEANSIEKVMKLL
ncbi:MAG: ABC transporter ATP-binding protein [Cyclobacteriaceae bacterium]